MIIVAAIYISSALWWTRKMIVQPLAIIGSHFDSIAAGNLARPIAVYGRNEITAIFASLKTMQQALRGTVSDVRKGSQEMHIGIAEIVAGNNDLKSYRTAGGIAGTNGRQYGAINRHGRAKRR